jgi:heme exporter protein A
MILQAHNLQCARGGRLVLHGVDFAVGRGEALLLMGSNGCGKSTLLRALAGLVPLCGGLVQWGAASGFHYVGHLDGVKPELTPHETMEHWLALNGGTPVTNSIADALARVDLYHMRDRPVRHMSAGQKRRLALARLFLRRADVWLLDEPTAELDAMAVKQLLGEIETHRKEGGAVIMATHHLHDMQDHKVLWMKHNA